MAATVHRAFACCQAKVRRRTDHNVPRLLSKSWFTLPRRGRPEGRAAHRLTGAGPVLQLIRDREGMTRSDLARITGLARSTVAQRVDALLAHELVYEAGGTASTGGRPPTLLTFNQRAGVVLVADLGATHSRLAASDLAGAPAGRGGVRHGHRGGPGAGPRPASTSTSPPCSASSAARRRTFAASASASPARSPSARASRSSRRSCRAGTASRSRAGSPAATTRPCSSTTTSTSWPWASTGRTGARPST